MAPSGGERADRAGTADQRAQTETIGVVLLLAITLLGAVAVVALGSSALAGTKHAVVVDKAEHAMVEFDSRASLVAHGSTDSRLVSIPDTQDPGVSVDVRPDAGWIAIEKLHVENDTVDTVVMNASMGAVVYENGETAIAYQGGGVWRETGNDSTMVSPPEFHYQSTTLTLPLVTIAGGEVAGGTGVLTRTASTDARYPDRSAGRRNPLTGGQVIVTVHSDYYRAWGRFFEQRTGGTVSYDHAHDRVTLQLVVPPSAPGVTGGIISGAGGDTLDFGNRGHVDSYNSTAGDYAATKALHTDVVMAGSVKIENQGTLKGDLIAGGSVTLENKANVTGNVSYGGTFSNSSQTHVGGWVAGNGSVDDLEAVGWVIDEKLEAFKSANNNTAAAAIDNTTDRLQDCGSTCELSAGDYYLKKIDFDTGDELVLNTTDGAIEIAVDNTINIDGDSTVRVVGNGTVRFYADQDFQMANQANVSVPGDDAPQLWVYMRPGTSADIGNTARFVGVIYGPGGSAGQGVDIDVTNQAAVFGALVGHVDDIPNKVAVHFDEALVDENPLAGVAGSAPRLTYLHVSTTPIRVEDR
ncbi:MAG: hypothetical protein ABEJ08_03995 [Halobacteriaceae archaeon]